NSSPLNETYTELYIMAGETGEVNTEHEVRQIEIASWKSGMEETTLKCEDIFKALPLRDKPRTVVTKGVAGIGKTVLTQKFTLDWAEDKTNRDIEFTFLFTFRELNMLKEQKYSLVKLVHHFFTEIEEAGISTFEDFELVFIFDGLDECRLPLNFQKTEIVTDITASTPVHVLLTNLIRGKLLPSAHIWITTRPAAASIIPPDCVDMVTEVRGFTDPQKEDYFKKMFRDPDEARSIISHIQASRSLHIMCHIPVFCWITAKVLEDMLKTCEVEKLPNTLTEMYIHFLVIQSKLKSVKYQDQPSETNVNQKESKGMIEALAKLAFKQLQKENPIFYEADLSDSGIDLREAATYSGVFTETFKKVKGMYKETVFCFVHLSVQEFLAALHVHLLKNKLKPKQLDQRHLDLFLRFLLGLSVETNQHHIRWLLEETESHSEVILKTAKYIRKKIDDNMSAERSINLFHCLNELNHHSLVEEIQQSLSSGPLSTKKLSPAQWGALVFLLLSSDKDLNQFDLKKYSASEETFLRLLPVVKASNKVLLAGCMFTEKSCGSLASVLSVRPSKLTELDLSYNKLEYSGVKQLCEGLFPHCGAIKELLILHRLSGCGLSERSSEVLSSVFSSRSSALRHLDLSNNDLQDSEVKELSVGLKSPCSSLETLCLSGCELSGRSCEALSSVLRCPSSQLRHLDLSNNDLQDSGVTQLSHGLKSSHCSLETLRLDHCGAQRIRPGLRKYLCELEVDVNTVNRCLVLSDNNRTVSYYTDFSKMQRYDDHPDRFQTGSQLLCKSAVTGRCYWEVEFNGNVSIALSYKGIKRTAVQFGNEQSWRLSYSKHDGYSVTHNSEMFTLSSPSVSNRVSVYVDCPAGTLSFYRVSSDSLIHLHTFSATFTGPVYPGFTVSESVKLSLKKTKNFLT
uniref:NACHT domain-containing protein n=1 Tax=Cynoglossus semilaevis TaxID=244447 RepID=A0A3P8WEZ8_CYNSE